MKKKNNCFIRKRFHISFPYIFFISIQDVRLNRTYFFIMKTKNKWELQQIAFNNSSDIDFKGFISL